MKMTEQLLITAVAFCEAKKLSLARVSTLIFNDGKRLAAIRDGGDLGTAQFERAMTWLSNEWPQGTRWPKGVVRPARPALAKAAS